MKQLLFLLLLAGIAAALLTPLQPPVASAQPEETPILGEPVVVTPLISPVTWTERVSGDDPAPAATANRSAPTPSAAASAPDACEPNDTRSQACPLPLDTISGPFTIVPDSDQDFFQLDLPLEPSIQTVITVRATPGLDLIVSARQGGNLVASGTYSLTLAPAIAGPIILRVENRDPRPATGEQYRIEVRREIAPPRQGEAKSENTAAPDALENNWSFDTAPPIAVGVAYDLTFACPEQRPNACPGGDHDYLRVPVKAGVRYLFTTFDLDPGVDTVIELFWGATTTAAVGNDDYAPGGALSALHWVAPSDGILGVRIAPRNGGLPQYLAEVKAGYRFAVAPEAGELARKLETTIRQQANVPTPTPTVAAAPSGVPPGSGGGAAGGNVPPTTSASSAGVQESIAAGPAIILQETMLRREPNERATALVTLAHQTRVTLRGPVSGLWVSVETDASILPGWVRFSDLQRVTAATPSSGAVQNSAAATPNPQQSAAAAPWPPPPTATMARTATSAGYSGAQVSATMLDPVLPAPAPPPAERVPFSLTVTVVASDHPPTASSALGFATPTPDLRQPVARVRVQLLTIFGDVLAEGLTDVGGVTQLRRDMRPGDALLVRIPAWGVELPLAPNQTHLILTIPEAQR